MIVTIVIAAVAFALMVAMGFAYAGRNRRGVDNIASFRREIDALSPAARKQTSDRMKPSERTLTGDDGGDER